MPIAHAISPFDKIVHSRPGNTEANTHGCRIAFEDPLGRRAFQATLDVIGSGMPDDPADIREIIIKAIRDITFDIECGDYTITGDKHLAGVADATTGKFGPKSFLSFK